MTGALRALLAKTDLTYAGAAFIGLRGDAWHALHERLQQIAIKRAPLSGLRMKGAQWVEPRLTGGGRAQVGTSATMALGCLASGGVAVTIGTIGTAAIPTIGIAARGG